MKKTIIATSLLLFAVASQSAEIEWKANWSAYQSGGVLTLNGQTVLDNWMLGLYQSTGTNPGEGFNASDLAANLISSTKVLIDTSGPSFTWTFGIETTQPSMANNIPIYSVLFNTTDGNIFTATPISYSYLILDNLASTAFDSGTEGTGFGSNNPYNLSTVAANSWVAVPEPATFLLFAMGGFGAWLIRRKQQDK